MRRTICSAPVFILAFALFASCTQRRADTPRETLPPGWTDAVRYRCAGIGEAGSTNTNKIRRRGIAKAAAVEDAKSVASDRFARLRYRLGPDERVAEFMLDRIESEFGAEIDGGVVFRESYDDDDNCEVILEIVSPDLLNRVLGQSPEYP